MGTLGDQGSVEFDPGVERETVEELGRRDKGGISADSAAPEDAATLQIKSVRVGRRERKTSQKAIRFLLGNER